MENDMKCDKCGGMMKKMDGTTMKCENCGNTMKMEHSNEETKE